MRAVRRLPLLIALAVVAGCGGDDEEPAAARQPITDVAWQLAEGLDVPGWQRAAPTATFTGGRVAGTTGCNRYSGTYTLDGQALRIADVATTRVGCESAQEAIEATFLERLGRVAGHRTGAGELVLTDATGAALLRFRPPTPAGRWTATALRRGGAVTSPLPGSEVTATFTAGGEVSGSAGCNGYHATYTAERGRIAIAQLSWTEMACPRPAGVLEQEQAFLEALGAAERYAVEGATLTLLRADGTIVATFERP